jgi:hypothetical protein
MIHRTIRNLRRGVRWSVGVMAVVVAVSSLSLAHSAVAHAASVDSFRDLIARTDWVGKGSVHVSTSEKALEAYKGEQAYNKVGSRQDVANQVANQLQAQIPAGDFIAADLQADGLHIKLRPGATKLPAKVQDVPVFTEFADAPAAQTLSRWRAAFRQSLGKGTPGAAQYLALGGGASWPDSETGTIFFQVPGNDAGKISAMRAFLQGLHPDIPLTVIGGFEGTPLQGSDAGGQQGNDATPFDGGAEISVTNPGRLPGKCHTWFNMRNNVLSMAQHVYGVTAGHCTQPEGETGFSHYIYTPGGNSMGYPDVNEVNQNVLYSNAEYNAGMTNNGQDGSTVSNIDFMTWPYAGYGIIPVGDPTAV